MNNTCENIQITMNNNEKFNFIRNRMHEKYTQVIVPLRALEKEYEQYRNGDYEKASALERELKYYRERCLYEFDNIINQTINQNWQDVLHDAKYGQEFLDDLIRFFKEGNKYKRQLNERRIKNLLYCYYLYIDSVIVCMYDRKNSSYTREKNDELNDIYSKKQIDLINKYYKEAKELEAQFLDVPDNDAERYKWDILRFEAHGYFIRGNSELALTKNNKLLQDVRFGDDYSIAACYLDIGAIHEWNKNDSMALEYYEKAKRKVENTEYRGVVEEATNKIKALLENK